LHGDAKGTRVAIRRDAGQQALLDAGTRRVEQSVLIEDRGTSRVESKNPAPEVEILEEAAHRRELEVAVRVDETGKQHDLAQVFIRSGRRFVARADIRNAPVVHGDGAALD